METCGCHLLSNPQELHRKHPTTPPPPRAGQKPKPAGGEWCAGSTLGASSKASYEKGLGPEFTSYVRRLVFDERRLKQAQDEKMTAISEDTAG